MSQSESVVVGFRTRLRDGADMEALQNWRRAQVRIGQRHARLCLV